MRRSVVILLFLGALLFSSSALAQGQPQTYSSFDRFVDNTKMIFTFGEKKVMLALNIREKELNSAIVNTKNGESEETEKNLERASKRLQYVQTRVSKNIVEDVKTNIDQVISRINEEEDLPSHFQTYILEEEKTQLTAELVSKVEGSKGQNLTREIVKDNENGESRVEVAVEGNDIRAGVMEIEKGIREIDNQIADIIVQNNVVKAGMDTDDLDKRDPNATPKTPAGDVDNTVDPGPQGIVGSDHEQ